jgi:hypothetical protein
MGARGGAEAGARMRPIPEVSKARRTLLCAAAGVLALVVPLLAQAGGKVENVRTSSRPAFDRIVLDLGTDAVDAAQRAGPGTFILELSAEPPALTRQATRALAKLAGSFEPRPGGSKLVIDLGQRSVRVFRLPGDPAAGRGDRLVVDLGPRGVELAIPDDAAQVPAGAPLVEDPASEPGGEIALAPATRPAPPEPTAAAPRPPAPAAPKRAAPPPPEFTFTPATPRDAAEPAPPKPPARAAPKPAAPQPAVTQPVARVAPKPAQKPKAAQASSDFSVAIRDIAIEGVTDPAFLEALAQLPVPVTPVTGGYVTPQPDAVVVRLPLSELAGTDGAGRTLTSGVLAAVVQTMADAFAQSGLTGIQVRISRDSLATLLGSQSDGRLVIQVELLEP